ncbi:MAG TPA: glycosyltransferase family 39 protein [Bacteriovoracaceae bacterium]|nr:glycosyltransferase family 39 protein [Bacteriovoracaceae bacterium]
MLIKNDIWKNTNFLHSICIAAGSLYCAGLTYGTPITQNVYTIFFILFLSVLFFLNIQKINEVENKGSSFIFVQIILLNLSIAVTAQILNSPDSFFWVQDSFLTHLPESVKYTDSIKNNFQAEPDLGLRQGRMTHALTGLSFVIFGVNTFATIFVQLIFKLIVVSCIYFYCRILWGTRVAFVAIQLYGFCPTIFFYNLVLYKEGAVQALLAIILLSTLKISLQKKYIFILPTVLALFLMSGERTYITYLLLLMFPFLIYNLPFAKNIKNNLLFLTAAVILAIGGYWYNPKMFDILGAINELTNFRKLYSSFSDVLNRYNYSIPYPLAFLKIVFSPYFSMNKFKIFSDFSDLLIWGSFINQIIIFSSILGFIHSVRVKILHLYLWIPFIAFLICAAYVSPWSGRIRDSFYPLIACYAAFYLLNNKYFKKIFNISDL